jgi:hypothetical protein
MPLTPRARKGTIMNGKLRTLKNRYHTWNAVAQKLGITKSYMSKLVSGEKPLTPLLEAKINELTFVSYYAHTGGSKALKWHIGPIPETSTEVST